jgi:hypothetical protein
MAPSGPWLLVQRAAAAVVAWMTPPCMWRDPRGLPLAAMEAQALYGPQRAGNVSNTTDRPTSRPAGSSTQPASCYRVMFTNMGARTSVQPRCCRDRGRKVRCQWPSQCACLANRGHGWYCAPQPSAQTKFAAQFSRSSDSLQLLISVYGADAPASTSASLALEGLTATSWPLVNSDKLHVALVATRAGCSPGVIRSAWGFGHAPMQPAQGNSEAH